MRTPSLPRALSVTLCLAACGAPQTTPRPTTENTPPTPPRGAEVPLVPALVGAHEAVLAPTCTAGDIVSLAALTNGVRGEETLARNARGALAAWLTDSNHDGRLELRVRALGPQGTPGAEALELPTEGHPAHPKLAPRGEGFVLVFRDGAPGQEHLVLRELDAQGAARTGSLTLAPTAFHWLGEPALVSSEGQGDVVVAVAAGPDQPASPAARGLPSLHVLRTNGAVDRVFSAPTGRVFDGESAPVLAAGAANTVRAFALTYPAGAQPNSPESRDRALVEPDLTGSEDKVTLVARGVDAPTALSTPRGLVLGWTVPEGRNDVAVRVLPLGGDGGDASPPVTLATFRAAFGARVLLAPVTEDLYGAFTLSAVTDSPNTGLSASTFTPQGQFAGRQLSVFSANLRSTELVAATWERETWLLFEARAEDATAGLGLVPIRCDAATPLNRMDVTPPTTAQEGTAPDPPTAGTPTPSCTVTGAPRKLFDHYSATENSLTGSQVALVPLANATLALAVARTERGGALKLWSAVIAAAGEPALTAVAERVTALHATAAVGTGALALYGLEGDGAPRLLSVAANGRASAPVALPFSRVDSAVITAESGQVFLVGEATGGHGDVSLFSVAVRNGRPSAPVLLGPMKPGDVVLDALSTGRTGALVLLGRRDPFTNAVALGSVQVPTNAARIAGRFDPFADPLGYVPDRAVLTGPPTAPALVYPVGTELRSADILRGMLQHRRSLATVMRGGGRLVSQSHARGGGAWLALTTGYTSDENAVDPAPYTVFGLGPGGALQVSAKLPDEEFGAVPGMDLPVSAQGTSLTVALPRVSAEGLASWSLWQGRCDAPPAP